MKKKLSLMLCLVVMLLTMAACGADPASVDYYGMTYEQIKSSMEEEVSYLVSNTENIKNYVETNGAENVDKLFVTWSDVVTDLGAYQGLGDFNLTKAQETITAEQYVMFQEREVIVTYVLEYNYETEQVELIDANTDLVYSLGEKMSKAAMNTLMGMGTVFVVLILISLIIYCFRFISVVQDKIANRDKKEETVAAAVAVPVVQPREQHLTDDLELVAVIAAAIDASTGTSTDSFVVRSIRRR